MKTYLLSARLRRRSRRAGGFTLAEVIIGMGVLGLFMAVCFTGIVFNRVASMKAKEQAIATDFLVHYGEMIKALPFNAVARGMPVNPLFDGTGGSPIIIIPANNSPVPVNTSAFEAFHPDLIWLDGRNPKLTVTLTTASVGGVPHDTDVNLLLEWDPPLGRGARQQMQIEVLRTKDL